MRASALALIALVLPARVAAAFDDAFKTLGFQWDISAGPIPVSLEPSGPCRLNHATAVHDPRVDQREPFGPRRSCARWPERAGFRRFSGP